MSLHKYLDRLHHLDALIRQKSTGTPQELARKMNVSVSLVYRYIKILKELGAPVRWCAYTGSYMYDWEGRLEMRFLPIATNGKRS